MYLDPEFANRLAELALRANVGWVIAVICIALFAYFLMRVSAQYPAYPAVTTGCRLRKFCRAEGATASMEYLMVLFPFLVIIMTVWQLAFMLNAQLHVGYSVYAAARSAAVMIPAELDSEPEGKMTKDGKKWSRILNASIPGTIAISPGHGPTAIAVGAANSKIITPGGIANLTARLTLMQAHHPNPGLFSGNRALRTGVKNAYAQKMTEVLINDTNHSNDLDFTGSDLATVNVDTIKVTVNYVFWLQVPYVGRTLAALFGNNNFGTRFYPSMELSESIVINTWPRRRAIKPCTP